MGNTKTLSLLVFFMISKTAYSYDWSIKYEGSLSAEYDDNPLLTTQDNAESTLGSVLSLSADGRLRSESFSLSINPRYNSARYNDENESLDLDRDDRYLDIRADIIRERNSFSFATEYSDASTRTSELTDSGRIGFRVPRQSLMFSAAYSTFLDLKNSLQASFSSSTVEFENGLVNGFLDYDIDSFSIGWVNSFTERTSVNATAYTSSYKADAIVNEQDTDGFFLGLNHAFSERLDLALSLGRRQTTSTIQQFIFIFEQEDKNDTANFDLSYRLTDGRIRFKAERSLQPSSVGSSNERDLLEISFSKRLNEKINTRLWASRLENQAIVAAQDILNSTEINSLGLSVEWRFTERWILNSSYLYRERRQAGTDSTDANIVRIGVSYRQ